LYFNKMLKYKIRPPKQPEGGLMRRLVTTFVACAAVAGLSGCRVARDLLPRTHTVSTSPDGRTRAFIRQHLNSDPPDDHLYIVPPGGRQRHVMALAPDMDWSRTIVWSPDSRKVGFVINDQRLALFDAATFELEAMLLLVSEESQEAQSVALTDDHHVSFELIERALVDVRQRDGRVVQVSAVRIAQFRPGSRVSRPARGLGRRTKVIPTPRLLLRVQTPEGRPIAVQGWARMQSSDGRQVRVGFSSAADGSVRLPAFEPGPFSIVEVARAGSRRTTVLRNVAIGDAPMAVTLHP
jgi:hypothetical protein